MAWIREKIDKSTERWTPEDEYNNNNFDILGALMGLIAFAPLYVLITNLNGDRFALLIVIVTNAFIYFKFRSFFETLSRYLILIGIVFLANNLILIFFTAFFLTEQERKDHIFITFLAGNIILVIVEIVYYKFFYVSDEAKIQRLKDEHDAKYGNGDNAKRKTSAVKRNTPSNNNK